MSSCPAASHHYLSQRLRLHYLDWGNEGAPILILLHGGRDHARSWDWVAEAMRDRWRLIAPDLRGHGDSAWSPDGAYTMPFYICDLAQLIHQLGGGPVAIVAHSLGGSIALRYAGLYPEKVSHLVAIEGLAHLPTMHRERDRLPPAEQWRRWIDERRGLSARLPRRYASIQDALDRMRDANRHLTDSQARHLTTQGMRRNEDGSFSWKFDNYVRSRPPGDLDDEELQALWSAIECPTMLVHGLDSWADDPLAGGQAAHFRDVRVISLPDAGHWPHHDQFQAFMTELRAFLE